MQYTKGLGEEHGTIILVVIEARTVTALDRASRSCVLFLSCKQPIVVQQLPSTPRDHRMSTIHRSDTLTLLLS